MLFVALRVICSTMLFELKKHILCKVPSSRSGIALRFGTHPYLSLPMLCSLLFSNVQNNIARFPHQLPGRRDAWGRNVHTSWGWRLNMLPYPSSAWASTYGASTSRKCCGSRACYAVCWMHPPMKWSGRWLFSPTTCERFHRAWTSHVQPTLRCTCCYFFTLPLLSKMLDFPDWNCFTHRKTVAIEGAGDGLADRSWVIIYVADCPRMIWSVHWRRTECRRRSQVFHNYLFRRCLVHGSQ